MTLMSVWGSAMFGQGRDQGNSIPLVVAEITRHGDNMILNIPQI